jgi:3-oxoacyl-[acyl-carrier-protein] synthase-1
MTSSFQPIAIRARAALSCFGEGKQAHTQALKAGKAGLLPVAAARGYGSVVAGAMEAGMDAGDRRPFVLAEQTLRSLGLTPQELRESALFVGTTTGTAASEEITFLGDRSKGLPWRAQFLCGGPGRLAAYCAQTFGIRGPCFTYTTACTSTAVGLVMAARMIRQGKIRRAIVFGLDLLMKMSLEGFRLLQLYSEAGCRPFDARRDGLQLGEGSAALVLEAADGPLMLLDGAISHDPGHIAAGSTDGATAAQVMNEALEKCGVKASEIAAIKAHGTATLANDVTELNALNLTFAGKPPPFTSLKSTFGHTLGASAALELVTWTWCAEDGFIPGTLGFGQRAPETQLTPQLEPRALPAGTTLHLFNSFGFGGTSVSFVAQVRR